MVEECTETVEEVQLAKITLAEEGENKYKCSSCTLYIVSFSIIFTINVGIGTNFVYCKYIMLKKLKKSYWKNHVEKIAARESFNIIKQHLIIRLIQWLPTLA